MNSHTFDILRKFLEKHNADEREWDAIDALQEAALLRSQSRR